MYSGYKPYLPTELAHGKMVFLFNIGADKLWNSTALSVTDNVSNCLVNRMEESGLLLANAKSILIFRNRPDDLFIDYMKVLGVAFTAILTPQISDELKTITQLVLADESILTYLRTLKGYCLMPYAVTPYEEELASKCSMKLLGPLSSQCKQIGDKIFAREMALNLGLDVCRGMICNYCDIDDCISELYGNGCRTIVLKDRYGVSGNGLYFINDDIDLRQVKRIMRIDRTRKWIIEEWYDNSVDINYQLFIRGYDDFDLFLISEQILKRGVYRGTRTFSGTDKRVDEYKEKASLIANYLAKKGYAGIVSIDSIVTQNELMIPIIEINTRFSLSTFLIKLFSDNPDRMILSESIQVSSNNILPYGDLFAELSRRGIAYDIRIRSGVLISNSATLPSQAFSIGSTFLGRLYTVIIANSEQNIKYLKMEMYNMLDEMQLSIIN
jgi:hypothetical protein